MVLIILFTNTHKNNMRLTTWIRRTCIRTFMGWVGEQVEGGNRLEVGSEGMARGRGDGQGVRGRVWQRDPLPPFPSIIPFHEPCHRGARGGEGRAKMGRKKVMRTSFFYLQVSFIIREDEDKEERIKRDH